ncbi:STAS domain-containing protein [Actinospica sp. MGRD01-02]|uniref:STAS domain-containing protein n=1 Tax=Actinospica acidithermotolerans TaxID=2828514 RepID=A0A941E847_9ACTN|nr:STAS domain-containing protein [Actinospica acidithermotolerans]
MITATGEIDLSSCARLGGLLSAAVGRGTTVLELSEVGFCDSSGLRLLVEAGQARAREGHGVATGRALPGGRACAGDRRPAAVLRGVRGRRCRAQGVGQA